MSQSSTYQQYELAQQDESSLRLVASVSDRYRKDPDFRRQLDEGDVTDVFGEFGAKPTDGIEYRFVADSDELVHFIMPPDPNLDLADEQLSQVSGGSCASSAGSIGSLSSMLTFTSFSTAACAGTVGSAGSAG